MSDQDIIWKEYDYLNRELLQDILTLEAELQNTDTQTSRRCFCRSVIAYIEGVSTWMSQFTVHLNYPHVLGDEEKRELERRSGAIRRLYNAFDLYTDTSGAVTPFEQNSNEWNIIHAAIKIRNRVTHPTCGADLWLSDDDVKLLRTTSSLFQELLAEVFKRSGSALIKKAKDVSKVWTEHHNQEVT